MGAKLSQKSTQFSSVRYQGCVLCFRVTSQKHRRLLDRHVDEEVCQMNPCLLALRVFIDIQKAAFSQSYGCHDVLAKQPFNNATRQDFRKNFCLENSLRFHRFRRVSSSKYRKKYPHTTLKVKQTHRVKTPDP